MCTLSFTNFNNKYFACEALIILNTEKNDVDIFQVTINFSRSAHNYVNTYKKHDSVNGNKQPGPHELTMCVLKIV